MINKDETHMIDNNHKHLWNEDLIDPGEPGGDKIQMVFSSWPVLFQSGIYDGDMIISRDYTQPDKAGSFGFELTNLFQ